MAKKKPPHPGLAVRHDCIEPLGLTVAEAAKHLGVSRKQLSDLVTRAFIPKWRSGSTRRAEAARKPGTAGRAGHRMPAHEPLPVLHASEDACG